MREIFLIRIGDQQYAVWKDEIESVTNIPTLHRLPLSPSCIAGMSIIDGRTITLADLPVCIGHAPASANGKSRILMLSGNGKISGFLVQGEIDSLALQPDALVPMPGYLTTEVIDSCAILASAPIPVINLHQLVQHLLKDGHEQPQPSLSIPAAGPRPAPAAKFRLFSLNEELFAADAADIEDAGAKTGNTAALSAVPRYVKGIVLHDRALLPLIDLAQRISLQPAANTDQMLVARFGDAKFGLLIDQDHSARSLSEVRVRELPPLARSFWLSTALGHANGIVPVIDIAALLSHDAVREETPLHQRYHPDSSFPSLFGTADADIVEFSLLGAKHALPKAEVADVIPFKPWRVLPGDAPEIMTGVAEHEGEILPVLDLAMVFGRRSLTTPDWEMMVVKNGDFRALVITDTVFGERRLPLAIQRAVPILLPHRVVYGCYPDAEAVRLILNVEAMAVHFEKSLVQELLPAMSVEMKQAPAQIVPSLLPEKGESGYDSQAQQESELQPEPVADSVSREKAVNVAEEIPVAAEAESSGQEEAIAQAGEEGPPENSAEAVSETAAIEEPKAEESDALPTQSFEEPAGTAEEQIIPVASSEEQAIVEERPDEEIVAVTPAVETIAGGKPRDLVAASLPSEGHVIAQDEKRLDQAASEEPTISEAAATEAVQIEEKAPEQETPVVTEPVAKPPVAEAVQEAMSGPSSVVSDEQELQPEPEKQAQPEPAAASVGMTGAISSITEAAGREQTPAAVQQPVSLRPEESRPAADRPSPSRPAYDQATSEQFSKKWIPYAAAAVILIGLLYFVGTSNKPAVQKNVQVAERAASQPAGPKAGSSPIIQKQQPTPAPEPKPQPKSRRPSLELDIPKNLPVSTELYIVVRGDTLWSISERFTGNPFNYPRIAGENRIADPDLIFPGQKIRLVKK